MCQGDYVHRAMKGRPSGEQPTDYKIVEIDGRPALDVFEEYLKPEERQKYLSMTKGARSFEPISEDNLNSMEDLAWWCSIMFGMVMGEDESGETVHKQLVVVAVEEGSLVLFGGVEVSVGAVLERLVVPVDQHEVREKTSWTANHVMQEAGFDFDSVQGALVVGCSLFYFYGGNDDGAQHLSEKLGEALSFAPTMGILGGPELGPMGQAKSEYTVFTVGCIVFSSKPAKAPRLLLTQSLDDKKVKRLSSVFVG